MPKLPAQRHEEFVFEIGAPSWSYGFALQLEKWRKEPYSEHHALEFKATCLYPDRLKGRIAEVSFYGERDWVQAAGQPEKNANGVGFVIATKTRFQVWGHLPSDACWELGHAIALGTVRYLLGNAPVFQPKHSFLNSLSFYGPEFDAIGYIG